MRPAKLLLALFLACPSSLRAQNKHENNVDLRITLGGFREGHPDDGKLEGICTLDATRAILDCDIYNGLEGWAVSEITLWVTWSPYKDDDKRYYVKHVSIEPLTTKRVNIRLGIQLPQDTVLRERRLSHWGWQLVQAKGRPIR
jgi:hypothetical protein